MTEVKYLSLNALIAFFTATVGVLLMTTQENYTYLFLVVSAAFVGFRDLAAAKAIYDEL